MSDHRSRTAADRRARMRARLVETAVFLAARYGPERARIDDVVAEAGVARGTFYQYFRSTEEIIVAAQVALGRELIQLGFKMPGIPPKGPGSASERVARDILRLLSTINTYPVIGDFAVKFGTRWLDYTDLMVDFGPEPLIDAMTAGEFSPLPLPLLRDLVHLGVVAIVRRGYTGPCPERTEGVAALLRMLGLPDARARHLAALDVAPARAPVDSLIARADAIRQAHATA